MNSSEPLKLAIMQPYFLPYLGYWQLMNYVDKFVLYDDIEFTKKGWIHRNRYLSNNNDRIFTLPLKKGSDYLHIRERQLADSWAEEKRNIRRKIDGAYRKAPHFDDGIKLIDDCFRSEETNLFYFLQDTIFVVRSALGISTELIVSSTLGDTTNLRSSDRVIEICKRLEATDYINPIGGVDLYAQKDFFKSGLSLKFHRINKVEYQQFSPKFLPNLSILDVIMFNGIENTKHMLAEFDIL